MTRTTTDQATRDRRAAATDAFKARMHAAWHASRGLKCERLDCEHRWMPR